MAPLLSEIQTFLPYLLVIWLIPFLIIAVKMMRAPTVARLEEYPYIKNRALFSPAERSLLEGLEQAVGKHYRVFGKVRAADIVSVRPTADRSVWLRAFNQISAQHFDFVLCDKDNLSIRCAVELNVKSHESSQHRERDTFLEAACREISLPFVQIQAGHDYSAVELRKLILAAMNLVTGVNPTESDETFAVGRITHSRGDELPWTIR